MSSRSVRSVLPLALVTCASMLAIDLFLPAVPALQQGLGLTVAQGQLRQEVTVRTGYRVLLRDARNLRIAASHALCFGALITFVASGPQMLANSLGLGPSAFAIAQVVGVGSFILVASQAGRIGRRIGAPGAITLGARLHLLLCGGFLVPVLLGVVGFAAVLVFWSLFCGVLAVRGPAAFSEALAVPPAQMGRASALLVLALLAAGAAGTQLAAPFLDRAGAPAVIVVMTVMTGISLLIVTPYPAARLAARPAAEG